MRSSSVAGSGAAVPERQSVSVDEAPSVSARLEGEPQDPNVLVMRIRLSAATVRSGQFGAEPGGLGRASTAWQLLFRATRCQEPSRKEYQVLIGAAAREPKYRKYPATPDTSTGPRPGTGCRRAGAQPSGAGPGQRGRSPAAGNRASSAVTRPAGDVPGRHHHDAAGPGGGRAQAPAEGGGVELAWRNTGDSAMTAVRTAARTAAASDDVTARIRIGLRRRPGGCCPQGPSS